MTSKERLRAAVEHRQPDRLPVDFGASFITGIHCSVVENLRRHYGLDPQLAQQGRAADNFSDKPPWPFSHLG